MTIPAVELIDVSYRYPRSKRSVIRKLNLRVEKGEFLVVMGENGAGKSTFCQILNGIIPLSAGGQLKGQVLIDGLDTSESTVGQLSTKVGIVLEDPETQLFTTSVLSEVAFGPENLNVPVPEILERIKWVLDVVQLNGYEDRMPTALSGGQKQRLAIAAALSMRPSILVLDESTSQIDPLGVKEVYDVVLELNKKHGMTIVMATDQSEEIARVADRVLVLDHGREVALGTPREIFGNIGLFKQFTIRAPQVSQLGAQLIEGGRPLTILPTTLEEAREEVEEALKGVPLDEKPVDVEPPDSPAAAEPVISVEDLTYIYQPGNVKAVKNIHFEIHRGEFVALIGQNGSGKTTTLKNMLGLLRPTSGRVVVAGMDTREVAVADLAQRVGFVLQNPDQQLFAETVHDEIAFGPRNLGVPREEIEERIRKSVEMVGLEAALDEFPPALPKGERAKVVIASALAMNPEIVILDEPTTGQDYKGCHQILQIARTLHSEGRTVVFVTHHMALVAEYAQRVIVMRDGEILLDDTTERVFVQTELVRQAHIIPPQITELGLSLPEELGLPRTPLTVRQMAEAILVRLNANQPQTVEN